MVGAEGDMTRLRLRMATATVASLLGVAAVGWIVIDALCRASLESEGSAAARAGAETLAEIVRSSSDELGATLGSLAGDGALSEAVEARDARRILAVAGPRFHELRRHGITHWSYWQPEPAGSTVRGLRNLVRLGTPTLRGDLVLRETLARVAREKALSVGLELGYTGFGLRAVAPIRRGDRVVGYAELGRNVEVLVAELARRTGDEFAVVLHKADLDEARWASARAARGERNDWSDLPALVLAGSPAHAHAIPPVSIGDLGVDGGGDLGPGLHVEAHRTFARGVFPLQDGGGRRIGAVFVFRDVTELARRSASLQRRGFAGLGLGLLVASAVIGAVFELLVARARPRGVRLDPTSD
jgi:hypothetical protein